MLITDIIEKLNKLEGKEQLDYERDIVFRVDYTLVKMGFIKKGVYEDCYYSHKDKDYGFKNSIWTTPKTLGGLIEIGFNWDAPEKKYPEIDWCLLAFGEASLTSKLYNISEASERKKRICL